MIDKKYKVRRFVMVYCKKTEESIDEWEFDSFDLHKFQKEFEVSNPENPMFDCFEIHEKSLLFIKQFMTKEPGWDFQKHSYFLEAETI